MAQFRSIVGNRANRSGIHCTTLLVSRLEGAPRRNVRDIDFHDGQDSGKRKNFLQWLTHSFSQPGPALSAERLSFIRPV